MCRDQVWLIGSFEPNKLGLLRVSYEHAFPARRSFSRPIEAKSLRLPLKQAMWFSFAEFPAADRRRFYTAHG